MSVTRVGQVGVVGRGGRGRTRRGRRRVRPPPRRHTGGVDRASLLLGLTGGALSRGRTLQRTLVRKRFT